MFNLFKYTKRWIGTDFSKQMILEAMKRDKYEKLIFKVADATVLSFTDEQFYAVVISNVLHIMLNPEKTMQEIYRVLKPNGILFAPTFLWK